MLWRIDPLLSGDSTNKTSVSGQRLGKHVPAETKTHATIDERRYRCCPCRGAIKYTIGAIQSVEGWQFSGALQGRLRGDGAVVQMTDEF
jgi:hypothetical protein